MQASSEYDGASQPSLPELDIRPDLQDLLASLQAHGLLWALTLIVMLEEDAAMLAFVFS